MKEKMTTHENWIELAKEKNNNLTYKGENTWKCSTCHSTFTRHPRRVCKKLVGCPACATHKGKISSALAGRKRLIISNKLRVEKIKQKLLDYPNLKLMSVVTDDAEKIRFKIKCRDCGDVRLRFFTSLIGTPEHTTGCKICSTAVVAKQNSLKSFEFKQARLERNKGLTINKAPDSMTSVSWFKCLKCDHDFESSLLGMTSTKRSCPKCDPNSWVESSKKRPKRKSREITIKGATFTVSGYEDFVLKWLFKRIPELRGDEVICSPTVGGLNFLEYTINGLKRKHYPDIRVDKMNLLVEVKSSYTLGLPKMHRGNGDVKHEYFVNKAKARCAIRQGFNYRVVVFHLEKGLTILPKHFFSMPVKTWVNSLIWRRLDYQRV